MTRNIFIFLGTFVTGALITLIARAAMFKPTAGHEGHPASGGDYAAMVTNPLTPANTTTTQSAVMPSAAAPSAATADPHANHGAAATPATAGKPVNTVCAICGMAVDPSLPTLEYQGKTIGFGCKLCAPKFKADPERYGPQFLKNEALKR